jgi:hypothetical protein
MSYTHSNFTGYYSNIQIIEEFGKKYVLKTIRVPMSFAIVQDIEQRLLLQRTALEAIGILIPELIQTDIIQGEESYNLLIKERFEGLDFVDVVDEHNFEFYIDKLLNEIYKPLLLSTQEKYLKAGIDPVARNFVYQSQKNQFCYVDFIPPKVYYKGYYSQEIPEIKGPFYDIRMISHYERSGVIYVQYINLIRIFPEKRKFIQGKIEQFLDGINQPELTEYIVGSPFYRLDNIGNFKEIVETLDDWKGIKYYHLREAICIASQHNSKFREKQSEMFALTTHQRDPASKEYGLLKIEDFNRVKKEVVQAII